MDAIILNTLRDPAGVPFYPVVFQALYILTWALHIAFVLLAMGSMGLSLFGRGKQESDANWRILTPHLIQTGKLSVSILIVLGVAPLLFTQVIYDPNWYVTNALSGVWVFSFIYIMILAYVMYYWYYHANKNKSNSSTLIGSISFLLFLCAGVLMHVFAVESIQPDKWMQWYAPNGHVVTSGLNFHLNFIRLLFMLSLSIPVLGIFLQNYSNFLSTREDFAKEYIDFTKNLGTKLAVAGLLISAVLFVLWMLQKSLLFSPLSLAIIVSVLILLFMVKTVQKSYFTTGFLVIVALLISGMREFIKYHIMLKHGYDIYNYPMNIDWPSVSMFLLTFVFLGFTGVGFITTMAWKVGKTNGIFDASKDVAVTKLANATLIIVSVWCAIYFSWGIFTLFKNTL